MEDRFSRDGRDGRDRPKVEWETLREFKPNDDPHKLFLVVRVTGSIGLKPRRYSIQVGRVSPAGDNRVLPNVPIFCRGQGTIEIVQVSKTLSALIEQAEEFVRAEAQWNEDAWAEKKSKFEKPKGLKALAKMDAEKRKASLPPGPTGSSPGDESGT